MLSMTEQTGRYQITAGLIGMRVKGIILRLVSLAGIGLMLYGALPIFTPFIVELHPPLLEIVSTTAFDLRSIVYIVGGLILSWWST